MSVGRLVGWLRIRSTIHTSHLIGLLGHVEHQINNLIWVTVELTHSDDVIRTKANGCGIQGRLQSDVVWSFKQRENGVCENKIHFNRQTCRHEHTDPNAKQIHTGAASKKSFWILYVMCSNTFFNVIHSVKETLDDYD